MIHGWGKQRGNWQLEIFLIGFNLLSPAIQAWNYANSRQSTSIILRLSNFTCVKCLWLAFSDGKQQANFRLLTQLAGNATCCQLVSNRVPKVDSRQASSLLACMQIRPTHRKQHLKSSGRTRRTWQTNVAPSSGATQSATPPPPASYPPLWCRCWYIWCFYISFCCCESRVRVLIAHAVCSFNDLPTSL